MDRFPRDMYDAMPWAQGGTLFFTKPAYGDLRGLKDIPRGSRLPQYSEYYELQTYLDVLGGLPPGDLLDVGAGSGSLSYLFAHLGWNVTSCDFDRSAFHYEGGTFVAADLNQGIPASSEQFDLVVCKQVIEHLENPNHLIREFRRVLRRGGRVMLSTPNIASLGARFKFLRSGLPAYFENYWKEHRTILHFGQLESMLREFGFDEISFHTNRYEFSTLSSAVNGKRMRFLSPVLKAAASDDAPPACKYGQFLMISAQRTA